MNPENPKLKAYLAMKLEICQMTTEDLVEFNDEVLKNSTFTDESKVRNLIEKHLPDEPFVLSLVALTNILLDVTNQKMMLYLIQPAPLEWKP